MDRFEIIDKIDGFADSTISKIRAQLGEDMYILGLPRLEAAVVEAKTYISMHLATGGSMLQIASALTLSSIDYAKRRSELLKIISKGTEGYPRGEEIDIFTEYVECHMLPLFYARIIKHITPNPLDLRALFADESKCIGVGCLLRKIHQDGHKYLNRHIAAAVDVTREWRKTGYNNEQTFLFFAEVMGHELGANASYAETITKSDTTKMQDLRGEYSQYLISIDGTKQIHPFSV